MGIAWTYAGEQDKARASLERFMPHTRGMRQRLPLGRSIDQRVVGGATLSRVLWLQGERERALALAESCAAEAIEQQQAIVTCYVLIEAWVPLALLSASGDHAARAVHALTDVAARAGLKVAQACARAFSEYLHSLDEPSAERLQAYRAALDDLESLGFEAPRAMLVAQYACALGRAGRREEALAEAERALERCALSGDRWFESELVRIRGELLSDTQWEDAQACFATALEIASKQGCRSLRLRAATSLARSWHRQGRYADAVSVLSTVCESIQEGREWNDYRAAQALLMRSSEQEPAACD
jgi:tetratricopeptide (TPR) repeat protein